MSASANQLDEIYRTVREDFTSHPVISVTPIKGDPPDQYEITYTLIGMCKTDDGRIVESTDHKVELAIPFGFPHFPPSCKPKSDLFHPDFDPAAICLGDYWEKQQSLSALIVHIGRMINGEIYSTTNAFNEDATEWYLANAEKFPLADITWEIEKHPKTSFSDHVEDVDILEDTNLEIGLNVLSLEQEDDEDIILDTSFPEVDSSTGIDLELFQKLKQQKKYYSLLEEAEIIGHSSEELTQLCQNAREKIQQAEKFFHEAERLENSGRSQPALEKYRQVALIVKDFPTIDATIQRVKQSLALLNDLSPKIASDLNTDSASSTTANSDAIPSRSVNRATMKIAEEVKAAKFRAANEFLSTSSPKKNVKYLSMFIGFIAIGMGVCGYFWYSFTNKLSEAEAAYTQCSAFLKKDQFGAAKRSCDQALQLVGEIKIIHQDKTHQLKKAIAEIRQSEKLSQGLAGNVLVEGQYIPQNEAKEILSIKQNLNEANKLYQEEKWQPAQQLYQTILSQTGIGKYLQSAKLEDIRHKHLLAKFKMSYEPAQVSMQNNQWDDAIEKLLRAQKILVSLPESDRERYSIQLQDALQMSQFANLKEQGDQSFTGSDWIKAIASYNLALTRGQKSDLSPESIDAIRNNIKRAELYTAINNGNKAFASASWDEAIEEYGKASKLLVGDRNLSGETVSNLNIRKLARIILQASIIRDRQSIQALLEKNDLVKTRQIYQQIINNIAKSPFKAEQEFVDTTSESSKAMSSLDQKIFLLKREEYLKDNYQSLFIANYPAAIPEKLSNPVISSAKENETAFVFKLQCTETSGGRPLTLVMYYAYNKNTGEWSLVSEN